MKMHGGWSFIEAYNLPIKLRIWFFNRLQKHIADENEAIKSASQKSNRK
jgi:hypothetical protein